jgi:hypothetical protein
MLLEGDYRGFEFVLEDAVAWGGEQEAAVVVAQWG